MCADADYNTEGDVINNARLIIPGQFHMEHINRISSRALGFTNQTLPSTLDRHCCRQVRWVAWLVPASQVPLGSKVSPLTLLITVNTGGHWLVQFKAPLWELSITSYTRTIWYITQALVGDLLIHTKLLTRLLSQLKLTPTHTSAHV